MDQPQAYTTNPTVDYEKVFDVVRYDTYLEHILSARFLDSPITRVLANHIGRLRNTE